MENYRQVSLLFSHFETVKQRVGLQVSDHHLFDIDRILTDRYSVSADEIFVHYPFDSQRPNRPGAGNGSAELAQHCISCANSVHIKPIRCALNISKYILWQSFKDCHKMYIVLFKKWNVKNAAAYLQCFDVICSCLIAHKIPLFFYVQWTS